MFDRWVCFQFCILSNSEGKKTSFENVYVSPNSGDAGGGLGAAQYTNFFKNKNFKNIPFINTYLGPDYANSKIKEVLNTKEIKKF